MTNKRDVQSDIESGAEATALAPANVATAAELREQKTSVGVDPGDIDLSAYSSVTRWQARTIRPSPTLFGDYGESVIDLSGSNGSSGWAGTDGSRGRDGADLGDGKRGRGGDGTDGTDGGDGQHGSDARNGEFSLDLNPTGVTLDGKFVSGSVSFDLSGGRGGDGGRGGSGGSGGNGNPSGSRGSDGRGGNGGDGGDGGHLRLHADHPHALAVVRRVDVSGGRGGAGGSGSPSGRGGRNGKDGSYIFHSNGESGTRFGVLLTALTTANDDTHLEGHYTRGSRFEIHGISVGNGGDFTVPTPYEVRLGAGTPIALVGTHAEATDDSLTVRRGSIVKVPLTTKGEVDAICDIGHFGVHTAVFSGIAPTLCLNASHSDEVFRFSVNHRLVPDEVMLVEDTDRVAVEALAKAWNDKSPEAQSEFFSSRMLCHAAGPLIGNTRRRAELDGSLQGRLLAPKEMWARADANPTASNAELACAAHFFQSLPDDTRLKMMDASIFMITGEKILPSDTKKRLLQIARFFGIQRQWFEKNYPRALEAGDTKLGATITNLPAIAWYSLFAVSVFILGYIASMHYDPFINTSGGFTDSGVLTYAGLTMLGVVLPLFRWFTMRMSCRSCHSLNLRRLIKQEDKASLLGAADAVRCVDCGARGGLDRKAKAIMRGANLRIHTDDDAGHPRAKRLAIGATVAAVAIPPLVMLATDWVYLPSLKLLVGIFLLSFLSASLSTVTRLFPVWAAVAGGVIAGISWIGAGNSKEGKATRPGCEGWLYQSSAVSAQKACGVDDPNFFSYRIRGNKREKYWLAVNGKEFGPYQKAILEKEVTDGALTDVVTADTMIRSSSEPDWKRANNEVFFYNLLTDRKFKYFVSADGKSLGPYYADELVKFAKDKRLTKTTQVRRSGSNEWQKACGIYDIKKRIWPQEACEPFIGLVGTWTSLTGGIVLTIKPTPRAMEDVSQEWRFQLGTAGGEMRLDGGRLYFIAADSSGRAQRGRTTVGHAQIDDSLELVYEDGPRKAFTDPAQPTSETVNGIEVPKLVAFETADLAGWTFPANELRFRRTSPRAVAPPVSKVSVPLTTATPVAPTPPPSEVTPPPTAPPKATPPTPDAPSAPVPPPVKVLTRGVPCEESPQYQFTVNGPVFKNPPNKEILKKCCGVNDFNASIAQNDGPTSWKMWIGTCRPGWGSPGDPERVCIARECVISP